jgi:uncharacterized phage protein (TIGR01671 family)
LLHRVGITIENRGTTVFYTYNPDSIGEGTGILDINAKKASDTTKEIFEGDILKMPDREYFHSEIIGQVVYFNGSFVLASDPENIETCSKWNLYDAVHGERAYVIGNIMENPELLRGNSNQQSNT